jgi:large subunit ribosomal protein L16|tara:strand:- start:276 stop:689 length:414 start_codon:yes stop_codon:yes gene_type:complete
MRPRKTKFKKYHKPTVTSVYNKKSHLIYGRYGLVAEEPALITDAQLECCIMSIKRKVKRKGKLNVRVFPHMSVTKKPLEIRMGKGKGGVDCFKTTVKAGTVLFELEVASMSIAKSALRIGGSKLGFKTRVIDSHIQG